MSCDNVQEQVSSFLDGRTPDAERENVAAHIQSCRDCASYLEVQQTMRKVVRGLERPPVPAELTARLRVVASHERQRQLNRTSLGARWRAWEARIGLLFDNMMRPMAFPFAGGLVSSLMIFGLLVPSLMFHQAFADQALYTYAGGEVVILGADGNYMSATEEFDPRIQRADFAPPESANVVDMIIGPNGRVTDWSVVQGEMTADIANIILLGTFDPATNMGVPIPSKVRAFQIRNVQTPPIRVRS